MLLNSLQRFQLVSETAANMMASLQHCLTLFHQQEDVRVVQLKQEQEKCRVLEEALNVLAREHHELEQSVVNHETGTIPRSFSCSSSRIFDTDDEFFDAFNEDSDTDTLVETHSIFNTPSGSVLTLLEEATNGVEDSVVVRKSRRRLRRTSSRELMSSSTSTLTQYFTDDGRPCEVSSSTESSSSSSDKTTSSDSTGSMTHVSSQQSQSQSTTSYYTQECPTEEHGDDRRLVNDDEDDNGEEVGVSHSQTKSDKSNSSSDTLVGTLSNATSCATLSDVFYDQKGEKTKSGRETEQNLICLNTPVHRR